MAAVVSRSSLKFAAIATAWGAAMWGVLQIQYAQGGWSHAVCGPWGCGPPTEALVACHAAWLLILGPVVAVLINLLSPSTLRLCGYAVLLCGLAGVIGVGGWQAVTWWAPASESARQYTVQRYLFSLVCLIDYPAVQLMLCGVALRCGAVVKRRHRRADAAPLA